MERCRGSNVRGCERLLHLLDDGGDDNLLHLYRSVAAERAEECSSYKEGTKRHDRW